MSSSSSRRSKSSHKSSPASSHPGSEHITISLKELDTCTARVSRLCIYQTPLQRARSLQKLGIYHAFLVVVVSAIVHPTQGDLKKVLMIRAEKNGRDEKKQNAGIYVRETHVVSKEENFEKHSIDTHDLTIDMYQLLKVLTDHNPDYDLIKGNCQVYAKNVLRALVQKFGELHPEFRDSLNESLQPNPDRIKPDLTRYLGDPTKSTLTLFEKIPEFECSCTEAQAEGEKNEE